VKREPRKNPGRASVIYARRGRGPLIWFDGKKFTNHDDAYYFGTHDRARGKAQLLVKRFPILGTYKVWIGAPQRRRNPDPRTDAKLDEAAQRLADFSGHEPHKLLKVRPHSTDLEGLVIGELDLIGYRTKRIGIAGGKLVRYAHDFAKGSRPLLAVTSDGKQLYIVGGRYEFTDAGIEDR
jgi:hypothetical protein